MTLEDLMKELQEIKEKITDLSNKMEEKMQEINQKIDVNLKENKKEILTVKEMLERNKRLQNEVNEEKEKIDIKEFVGNLDNYKEFKKDIENIEKENNMKEKKFENIEDIINSIEIQPEEEKTNEKPKTIRKRKQKVEQDSLFSEENFRENTTSKEATLSYEDNDDVILKENILYRNENGVFENEEFSIKNLRKSTIDTIKEDRDKYIGGSDIYNLNNTIFNAISMYERKVNPVNIDDNEAIKIGNYLEPMIRNYINKEYKLDEINNYCFFESLVATNERLGIRGNCDGYMIDKNGKKTILEIKTNNEKDLTTSTLQNYYLQTQLYLWCFNADEAIIAEYNKDGKKILDEFKDMKEIEKDKLTVTKVQRNDKVIEELLNRVIFYNEHKGDTLEINDVKEFEKLKLTAEELSDMSSEIKKMKTKENAIYSLAGNKPKVSRKKEGPTADEIAKSDRNAFFAGLEAKICGEKEQSFNLSLNDISTKQLEIYENQILSEVDGKNTEEIKEIYDKLKTERLKNEKEFKILKEDFKTKAMEVVPCGIKTDFFSLIPKQNVVKTKTSDTKEVKTQEKEKNEKVR